MHAIAESPKEAGTIWVGTNDGLVQLTRDGGATWTNLTRNLPGLPAWGSVRSIAPSRHDAATAWLVVDFHQVNNRDPFVYRTRDYGKSWSLVVNGIPRSMLRYAKAVARGGIPLRHSLGQTRQPADDGFCQCTRRLYSKSHVTANRPGSCGMSQHYSVWSL